MGWDEVPVAPTVTMSCPGATVYGTPPTVNATVNQTASIVFSLDGNQVSSSSGTSASYTPGAGVSVGTHTIQVVASNTNGSGSVTCSWVVNPPVPTVTMECSGATPYSLPPTFTASVDYSATITFSISDAQGTVISTQSTNGTSASFIPSSELSPGTYSVCARATNISGTSNPVCCSWIVEDLEITLSCPGSTTYGEHPSFYAAINAPSTVTFYLDGNPIIPSWSGTQGVTYTPSTDVAVGTHVVSVHAFCGGEEASAECTWIVLPEPLTVSLSCPEGPDPVGTVKQFSATTNLPAKITFLVNGASKSYENVTNASIEVAQLNGGLTISVSAEALGMTDAQSCIWGASPLPEPLVITSVDPSAGNIEDTMATIRTFRATVNQSASISFYFDGLLVESSPINVTEWSYTSSPLPPGDHFIRVVAKNANGYDEYYWNWHSELVIINAVEGKCKDAVPDCGLQITALYKRIRYPEDSPCQIILDYTLDICTVCTTGGMFWGLYSISSLNIVISWPGGAIERLLDFGTGSQRGTEVFSIPYADYYLVTCSAETACHGIQFAKQEGPKGEIIPCFPLPMTYFANSTCSVRLPDQGNIP